MPGVHCSLTAHARYRCGSSSTASPPRRAGMPPCSLQVTLLLFLRRLRHQDCTGFGQRGARPCPFTAATPRALSRSSSWLFCAPSVVVSSRVMKYWWCMLHFTVRAFVPLYRPPPPPVCSKHLPRFAPPHLRIICGGNEAPGSAYLFHTWWCCARFPLARPVTCHAQLATVSVLKPAVATATTAASVAAGATLHVCCC